MLIVFVCLLFSLSLFSQHNNEFCNIGAQITIQAGAEVHVWGDVHLIGGLLNNNGLVKIQGNAYSDSLFQQRSSLGTGVFRIENSDTNKNERQFIAGSFAVRGGQSQINVNDGAFQHLELANDQGIVFLVADASSNVSGENLVADVKGSVDFNPTGSPTLNRIITHDVGKTGVISYPTNGSNYTSVFGIMNPTENITGHSSLLNNTVFTNGFMSGIDNAYIQGKLRRAILPAGSRYVYVLGVEPSGVGAQRGVQINRMVFSANNYDVISGYFQSASSNASTPTIDCSGSTVNYWGGAAHGEWVFNDITGMGAGTYTMTVWPQDDNFIAVPIWIITKDNAISGTPNGCGTTPVGLSRGGFDGLSEFGLAGVISPLPAELISLSATGIVNYIDVDWIVASEINLSHYELERSEDGSGFSFIASIQAQGNTQTLQNYNYSDIDVRFNTDYFYRLKSVDFDGAYEYSPIVSASLIKKNLFFSEDAIGVYPNPMQENFMISFALNQEAELNLKIFNFLGQIIESNKIDLVKGNTVLTINSKEWAPGVYFIEMHDLKTKHTVTKRIIKQ